MAAAPGLPIALDAMGGDNAPQEVVAGAVRAVAELDVPVALVGRREAVERALEAHGESGRDPRLSIVEAPDVIGMD